MHASMRCACARAFQFCFCFVFVFVLFAKTSVCVRAKIGRGERDTRCVWREKKDTEERKEEEEEEEGLFKANAVN